eukprot:GFYU01001489.1.p1 GENE.GFYU01001489.1~~GFYU01001489.1.p1  ORF type:complete len:1483 (-),score=523.62 GFYU01001489.1:409-4482(-)
MASDEIGGQIRYIVEITTDVSLQGDSDFFQAGTSKIYYWSCTSMTKDDNNNGNNAHGFLYHQKYTSVLTNYHEVSCPLRPGAGGVRVHASVHPTLYAYYHVDPPHSNYDIRVYAQTFNDNIDLLAKGMGLKATWREESMGVSLAVSDFPPTGLSVDTVLDNWAPHSYIGCTGDLIFNPGVGAVNAVPEGSLWCSTTDTKGKYFIGNFTVNSYFQVRQDDTSWDTTVMYKITAYFTMTADAASPATSNGGDEYTAPSSGAVPVVTSEYAQKATADYTSGPAALALNTPPSAAAYANAWNFMWKLYGGTSEVPTAPIPKEPIVDFEYTSVRESNPWALEIPRDAIHCVKQGSKDYGAQRRCARWYFGVRGDNKFPQTTGSSEYNIYAFLDFHYSNFRCEDAADHTLFNTSPGGYVDAQLELDAIDTISLYESHSKDTHCRDLDLWIALIESHERIEATASATPVITLDGTDPSGINGGAPEPTTNEPYFSSIDFYAKLKAHTWLKVKLHDVIHLLPTKGKAYYDGTTADDTPWAGYVSATDGTTVNTAYMSHTLRIALDGYTPISTFNFGDRWAVQSDASFRLNWHPTSIHGGVTFNVDTNAAVHADPKLGEIIPSTTDAVNIAAFKADIKVGDYLQVRFGNLWMNSDALVYKLDHVSSPPKAYLLFGADHWDAVDTETHLQIVVRNRHAMRLTEATMNEKGAVYYRHKLFLFDGFETEFQFQIKDRRLCDQSEASDGFCAGSDGFAFTIHNDDDYNGGVPLNALGCPGSGLGFADSEHTDPQSACSYPVYVRTTVQGDAETKEKSVISLMPDITVKAFYPKWITSTERYMTPGHDLIKVSYTAADNKIISSSVLASPAGLAFVHLAQKNRYFGEYKAAGFAGPITGVQLSGNGEGPSAYTDSAQAGGTDFTATTTFEVFEGIKPRIVAQAYDASLTVLYKIIDPQVAWLTNRAFPLCGYLANPGQATANNPTTDTGTTRTGVSDWIPDRHDLAKFITSATMLHDTADCVGVRSDAGNVENCGCYTTQNVILPADTTAQICTKLGSIYTRSTAGASLAAITTAADFFTVTATCSAAAPVTYDIEIENSVAGNAEDTFVQFFGEGPTSSGGARGIKNALTIEFDTWYNQPSRDIKQGIVSSWINATQYVDYSDNHVAVFSSTHHQSKIPAKNIHSSPFALDLCVGAPVSVMRDANQNFVACDTACTAGTGCDTIFESYTWRDERHVMGTSSIPQLNNGDVHTVKVRYVPKKGSLKDGTLTVFIDDMRKPVLSSVKLNLRKWGDCYEDMDYDLRSRRMPSTVHAYTNAPISFDRCVLDREGMAYIGFTAATGADAAGTSSTGELHDVHNWKFCQRPGCVPI